MTHNIQLASVIIATLLMTACNDETTASTENTASETQPASAQSTQSADQQNQQADTSAQLPERVKELEGKHPMKQQSPMQTTTVTGTVTYKDLEGGFFALITENGQRYLLQGMEEKYRQHGLVVNVTGKPRPDVRTIQQFGIPFEVSSVEIVDDSGVKPTNNEM